MLWMWLQKWLLRLRRPSGDRPVARPYRRRQDPGVVDPRRRGVGAPRGCAVCAGRGDPTPPSAVSTQPARRRPGPPARWNARHACPNAHPGSTAVDASISPTRRRSRRPASSSPYCCCVDVVSSWGLPARCVQRRRHGVTSSPRASVWRWSSGSLVRQRPRPYAPPAPSGTSFRTMDKARAVGRLSRHRPPWACISRARSAGHSPRW